MNIKKLKVTKNTRLCGNCEYVVWVWDEWSELSGGLAQSYVCSKDLDVGIANGGLNCNKFEVKNWKI